MTKYVTIEVDLEPTEVEYLVASGLATLDQNGLTLTELGNQWMRDWCEKELQK